VLAEAERSVVVVALALSALEELALALESRQPLRCADIFAKDGLLLNLSRKGAVAIALSGALPLDLKPGPDIGVDILVYGRNDKRAADEAIERFADSLGANAHVLPWVPLGILSYVLGHVVRGGIPSAADRVLATRLGAAAVDALAGGKHGVLVGIVKGDTVTTPLAEIAGKMRPADASLLELARVMAM